MPALAVAAALAVAGPAQANTIGYWKMSGVVDLPDNDLYGKGILDLATNAGEGSLTSDLTSAGAAVDNLFIWGDSLANNMVFAASAPPASMFAAGYSASPNSWDAGASLAFPGQVVFPSAYYGDELSTPSFTMEVFFKSDAPGRSRQTLIDNHQNAAYAILDLDEDGDTGSLLFWSCNASGCPTVRITAAANGGQRFDDGKWHYAAASYDAATRKMSLLVVNEDGSTVSASQFLSGALDPGASRGQTYIGTAEWNTPFNGQINQVRFSDTALPKSQLLALVPDCVAPGISAGPWSGTCYAGSPAALGVSVGDGAIGFQWRFNGSTLPGETNAVLNIASTQLSNEGNYDVVVFGPCSLSVTSSPAHLTVLLPPAPGANTVGYWKMDHLVTGLAENAPSGMGFLDLATNYGQGILSGTASAAASVDNLFVKGGTLPDNLALVPSAPPASMFNPPFTPSAKSWDAGANIADNGFVLFPQAVYGNELSTPGFTAEIFFKSDAPAPGRQTLLFNNQGACFSILEISEDGPTGSLLLWCNNGPDSYPTVRIFSDLNYGQRLDDGKWHYAAVRYDAFTGQMSLLVVNEDGTSMTRYSDPIAAPLAPFPSDTLIGTSLWDPATPFNGQINQVRFSRTAIPDSQLLAAVPAVNIARWSMEAQVAVPNADHNQPSFVGVADSKVDPGQGVQQKGGWWPAAWDHLITFNGIGGIVPLTNDVPPASMFINGNTGGTNSFNPSALAGVNGDLFFPQDQYGDEFDFQDSFSVELFFKTLGDQSAAGKMQLVNQGFGDNLRFGLVVNDAAAGAVTFSLLTGTNSQAVSVTNANFADGAWHYLLAKYDSTANQVSLTIVNTDRVASSATKALPDGYSPLPYAPRFQNMRIGRYDANKDGEPRTFMGLIDEVQISHGLVTTTTGQLGFAPAVAPLVTPHISNIAVDGERVTINFTGGTADTASAFALIGAATVNGTYTALPATITAQGSGNFQATIAKSGAAQFYRIKR